MSIPIILVWGEKTEFVGLGWTAQRCARCEKVQAFAGYDQIRSSHIYFIYGPEKNIGTILTCDFCESSFGLAPNSVEKKNLQVTRAWSKSAGLQALVDQTNPALGQVSEGQPPTQQELFALLLSVNERSGAFRLRLKLGWLIGAVAGAISLAVLANVYYRLTAAPGEPVDTGTTNFVFGTIGALLGAAIGVFIEYRNLSKRITSEVLASAMDRNNLFAEDLREALAKYPKPLKRVEYALAQLNGGGEKASTHSSPQPPKSAGGKRNVCPDCQLVNFIGAEVCKRCGHSFAGKAADS